MIYSLDLDGEMEWCGTIYDIKLSIVSDHTLQDIHHNKCERRVHMEILLQFRDQSKLLFNQGTYILVMIMTLES
jgi:hypothetical protein